MPVDPDLYVEWGTVQVALDNGRTVGLTLLLCRRCGALVPQDFNGYHAHVEFHARPLLHSVAGP